MTDAEWMAEMERRLSALERSPSLPNTSQRGGTYELLSSDGSSVFKFGEFTDPDAEESFGISAFDEDGNTVLATRSDVEGLVYPIVSQQFIVPTPQTITSGTFVAVAESQVWAPAWNCIYATAAIITDVGTTAEVRLSNSINTISTNTVTVPAASNGNVLFKWEHGFTVGWSAGLVGSNPGATSGLLQWQVRRASGGGNVTAYPPRGFHWVSKRHLPDASTLGGGVFV